MSTETPAAPAAAAPASLPPLPTAPAAPAPVAKVTPGSKAWAEMSQEQRFEQLRGPANPRARGHSPSRDQREAAAQKPAEPAPAAEAQAQPADGEPAPSSPKFKVGKFEVSEEEIAGMMSRQSAEDLRTATIPPTPDAYKLELAPEAKLPGGIEVKFDGNDPGLVAAKAWAHRMGVDQSAFSELLTVYASHVAQQEAVLAERSRAEIAKAGPNAPQRVDAIGKWIRAEVGDADARPILASLVTDAHLRFYEKLQQRVITQGSASFSQQHRVAPDTSAIPGYENMSFEQRRYAQDQQAAARRRG